MEFELAYYDVAVKHVRNYATETLQLLFRVKGIEVVLFCTKGQTAYSSPTDSAYVRSTFFIAITLKSTWGVGLLILPSMGQKICWKII